MATQLNTEIAIKRDAHFSGCGRYRYRLDRLWADSKPLLCFIMLNPSVADDTEDDPTVRKCIGFAERFGCGGFFVVNLYAYIATKPKDLKAAHWPTGGAMADRVIERTLAIVAGHDAGLAICAWGANARRMGRPSELLEMIKAAGLRPHALNINADGTPAHPLMLPYSCGLVPYTSR
ncbi:DUF1643 domain-containing protein [Caenimonas terrae]|uniref:DUF1643 domain-containing protein n=1 Tax=Caenimonas terrae TaxID=696074 RepID=A0ABW0NGL9_9BURK